MLTDKEVKDENNNSDNAKKKKNFLVVLLVVLSMISFFNLFIFRRWIFKNPFKNYILNEVSDITVDQNGNIYMICDAAQSLLKLSPDGILLEKINANDIGLSSINGIIYGGNDKLYIYEKSIAQGIHISGEKIYNLDFKSRDIKLIDEFTAKDDMVRASVIGLSGTKTGMRYIKKEKDSMLSFDETGNIINDYPLVGAEGLVLSAVTDETGNELYYTTYDGKVYHYLDKKDDEILYDSDDFEGSIPNDISYYDGFLYVTDIGLKDIIIVDTEKKDITRKAFLEDPGDRITEYFVYAYEKGIVSTGEFSITIWDGDFDYIFETELDMAIKIKMIILWISIIYLCVCIIFAIVRLLMYFMKKASIYSKVTMLIVSGIAVLVLLLVGTMFPEFTSQLTDQIYEKETLAAAVTSERIPKDSFLALEKPSDFMNEDYVKVREAVYSVFNSSTEKSDELYCVLYRVIDGTVTMTYTMTDTSVIYPYDWEYEGTDMQDLMENATTHRYKNTDSTGSYLFVHYPIYGDEGKPIGFIEVGTDLASVNEKNRNNLISLLLNVLAMTVVVVMLVAELMYYVKDKKEYQIRKEKSFKTAKITPGIFRFIVFLVFLFANLTCVILPLQAKRIAINQSLFGLSPAIIAAIPISAETISGAAFSALGGNIIRKLGAKKSILVSSIMFSLGLLLRAIPNIIMLTLGSVVLGAGWGILLILVNVQIAKLPEEEKDKSFAYYSISSISGINCGVVLGGFLVQWCSYTTVFLITAATSVILYFVSRKYLADNMRDEDMSEEKTETSGESSIKFIFKPSIIGFFVLALTPLLICGYFLNYMLPIMGSDWGLSESYISFAFMITGVIALCFGTQLTELFSKRNLRHFGLAVSIILYAEAFICIAVMGNVTSILIALVLIGFSNSFGIPLLTSYFTEIPEVEEFGYDRSFGVYSLFENGAQSLGAFVLGCVYNLGVRKGLLMVGLIITALALLFFLSSAARKKRYINKEN